jgi:hypothetical protein
MLNILKVIKGPTSIYTPWGPFKETSIEALSPCVVDAYPCVAHI